jgi:ABC-2 type transport system permease protein
MDKKRKEIIFGVLFLGILVFAGLDGCLYSVSVDATSSRMFSISDVSRNLFRDIPEQVHITYYLTGKLVEADPVYSQIEDILHEYANSSHGKIRLEVVDPAAANKLQEVEEFGIEQFPVGRQTAENEASFLNNASSGIVIQYLDRTPRVIPVVQSTDTLEYDLSSMIRALVSNRTRKVGYLVDAPDFSYEDFQSIQSRLQRFIDLQNVVTGKDVPQDLDALVVFGGKGLTDFDLYPIDQYVMRGGRVIFAADAVKVVANQQIGVLGNVDDKEPLFSLLKTYGVTVNPELVLEHRDLALSPDQRILYNFWFNTYQDFVSKDNPITTRMRPLYFFWASPLTVAPPPAVKAETLVSTSPSATVMQETQGQGFQLDPQQAGLMYNMLSSEHKGSYPLVVALSGDFPSYFKGKPIPTQKDTKTGWTKTIESGAASRIIVAGDSELFSPLYMARVAQNNLAFFIGCLDWLSNDEDLLAIRSRAAQDTLMAKITDPEARDTAATIIKIINLAGVPLLIIGAGVLNYFLRRRKKTADR